MCWRHLVSVLLAAFLAGAALQPALAQTADVTAALTEASKTLQKGGYAKAIEIIDNALRSGKVQSDLAAKALLMRAEANEKLGRTAFAFADYNSALWMQGLSVADRKRAEEGHARVQKTLGVAAPKDAPTPPTGAETAAAPASGPSKPKNQPWDAAVQETPSEERTGSTGGIGGFFNNLFGAPPSQPAAAPPQPAPTAAVVTPVQQGKQAGRPQQKPAPTPAPAVTGSIKPADKGNFAIQLAALAEEDKAIAEADRLAKKYGSDLGGRSPQLMIVPTSDGGTLYKIVAAPFETRSDGAAACEFLKAKGLSCMVITKK
jgi:cell division septation protein DedD